MTKKSIMESLGHVDKDFLADFTARHPEVFKDFKSKALTSAANVANRDLETKALRDVLKHLVGKLKMTKPGPDQATNYHRTVFGILELLFYPRWTVPRVEDEIHEGRKRIDITFENSAETGFFFRLPTTNQIPCRIIMIECKNYSREIANPELDQISGRFSVNRGQFGIVVCREIQDMPTFMERCKDTQVDGRGTVLPLTDDDLLTMLESYEADGVEACEEILSSRFRELSMR